jgi:site-specific DNA-methyltransferase (adenine-specific)
MPAFPKPTWSDRRGRVLLYHGDALDVLARFPDGSVSFVFTDPPYGHNNNNGDLIHRREAARGRLPCGDNPPLARPIANDGPEANELFRAILAPIHRVLRPGCCCCCCCCCGGGPDPQCARWSLWLDDVFDFKQQVIWDKGPMGMGWHYRRSYETVLVAQKAGAACAWYDKSHRVENVIRPAHGIRKIIPTADDHPTPKPPALAAHFIRLHSWPGQWVLDPFMGRASTGLAAASLGRKFIGIELDAEHFRHSVAKLSHLRTSKPLEKAA